MTVCYVDTLYEIISGNAVLIELEYPHESLNHGLLGHIRKADQLFNLPVRLRLTRGVNCCTKSTVVKLHIVRQSNPCRVYCCGQSEHFTQNTNLLFLEIPLLS